MIQKPIKFQVFGPLADREEDVFEILPVLVLELQHVGLFLGICRILLYLG